MNPKPRLHHYLVRLKDGKEIKVKAHEVCWEDTDNSLWFKKSGEVIVGFNPNGWTCYKLLK